MTHRTIKKANNQFLIFGNLWMLFFVIIPLEWFVFFVLWRDCQDISMFLLSLIVASAGLVMAIVYYVQPRNPFEGSWLMPRPTAFTKEEEKALQFLMFSKKAKQLVIKTGIFLFMQPFILILAINFIFPIERSNAMNMSIGRAIGATVGCAILYLVYSLLFYNFVIERYIIFHWKEIQELESSSIEHKQPSVNLPKDAELKENRSFFKDLLSMDPNTPVTPDLLMLMVIIVVAVVLLIWGVGAIGILFGKILLRGFVLRVISFIVGIVLLSISSKMLSKKGK